MKALTGAILALLTIVLVFFGFAPRATSRADAQQASQVFAQPAPADAQAQPVNTFAGGAQVVPVSTAMQAGAGWQGAGQQPVLVNCGPGTQTLVRPVWMNGQQVSQVECVPAASGVVYPAQVAQPVAYPVPASDVRVMRARSYDYAPAPRRVVRPRRSWQKTALVIGGSTAGGAGIGGLIGGKKGALIGAAIGGGASTLFEATRRR